MKPLLERAAGRWRQSWPVLTGLALMLLIEVAHAATSPAVGGKVTSFSLFDPIVTQAQTQSTGWFSVISGMVDTTFKILGTLELCWAAAIWAFEKDNLSSLSVEIIKKIMFIGFFYTLLQYAGTWIPTIVESFEVAGSTAAGIGSVSTDSIFATGLALIDFIWSKAPKTTSSGGLFHLPQIIVGVVVTTAILIAYVIIAAQYFVVKMESYILFAAGAIFLGMGSSQWTNEYVTKYLNYAVTVGVRLLVLILILALVLGTVDGMVAGFKFGIVPLVKILAMTLIQAILAMEAPQMATALLNGGVGVSAGSAFKAMQSAASPAAALAKQAASKTVSSIQGMQNLAKAAAHGRQLAKERGSGPAAAVTGMGLAAGQIARQIPAALSRAIKGKAAQPGQHTPGMFARADQKLQGQLQAEQQLKSGGASGGGNVASREAGNRAAAKESDIPEAAKGGGKAADAAKSGKAAQAGDRSSAAQSSASVTHEASAAAHQASGGQGAGAGPGGAAGEAPRTLAGERSNSVSASGNSTSGS